MTDLQRLQETFEALGIGYEAEDRTPWDTQTYWHSFRGGSQQQTTTDDGTRKIGTLLRCHGVSYHFDMDGVYLATEDDHWVLPEPEAHMRCLRDGVPEPPERWTKRAWRRVRFWAEAVWLFPKQVWWYVGTVWAYSPLLWRDRDWDHIFLVDMLRFKLTRMADAVAKNNNHTSADRTVRQIRHAVFLIDRFQDNEYDDAELAAHREEWGPDVDNMVSKGQPAGLLLWDLHNAKARAEGREDEERAARTAIYERGRAARERDKKHLFKHISKYLEYWWD